MMNRRALLLATLLGFGVVAICLWLRYGWLWSASPGWLRPLRASFELSGDVRDENGALLSDVELVISKSRSYPIGSAPTPAEVERRKINGQFEVSVSGYANVGLGFRREGFYHEYRSFDPSRDSYGRVSGTVVDRNIRVVLQRKGQPTDLTELDGMAIFRADQSATTLGFEGLSPTQADSRLVPHNVDNLAGPVEHPPHGIVVTAEVSDAGTIAIVDDPAKKDFLVQNAKRFTLRMTNGEDGFILVQPQGKRPRREMTRAPAEGYQQSVTVSPADLSRVRHDGRVSFYLRINGLYGRGHVTPAVSRNKRGQDEARFRLQLFMQPDGSTNLEDDDAGP